MHRHQLKALAGAGKQSKMLRAQVFCGCPVLDVFVECPPPSPRRLGNTLAFQLAKILFDKHCDTPSAEPTTLLLPDRVAESSERQQAKQNSLP